LVIAHPDKAGQQVVLSSLGQERDISSEVADLLDTLGRLWLAGVRVDWYGFHAHEYRHRLPLPTYPFQRQRYWIEPHKQADQPALPDAAQPRTVTKKPDLTDWFYVPVWKTAPSPKARDFSDVREPQSNEDEGPWLLFVDEGGIGAAMAERLRREGQTVVTVKVGEYFNRVKDDAYALDPRRRVHYGALFRDLQAADSLPKRVVHLWSVTLDHLASPDVREPTRLSLLQAQSNDEEVFRQAQDNGFYSLLFLAQVLGEQTLTEAVQLWVVSNQVQKVESADVPRPEKATVLGLCKVIPQENPYLVCHHVDVALPRADTPSQDDLSRQLLAEIGSQSPDTVVAYRYDQRWLQAFEPLRLAAKTASVRPLRENGVYLITSGLADISWALADYLARAVQARLVLVEDEAFPRREQWPQWLAKDGSTELAQVGSGDGVGRKIQNIRDLEAAGAEVLVVHADLTDEAQVQDALAQALARFGHLHGVLHAVGDMGDDTFKTILDTDYDTGVWSFENRMRGLLVLEKALAGHELDFCLLVSSLSSVLGGVGQAAYAAANLFMDALAARHRGPWLSVNWDAWQFEAQRGRIGALTPRLAQFAISAAEGGEAFQRILASYTGHQIVVSTGDLGARMAQWLGAETLQVQERPKAKRHARPHLPNSYVAPTTEVEQTLVDAWQEALGIEQIGIDDNFFDLGGDSLIAVRTITLLEKKLQTKIPTANLYQTPSVRALAELLSQDEEQATQERATKLEKRKEELSRRNLLLQQRHKR
jgi:acyl transferase domain-containing protein